MAEPLTTQSVEDVETKFNEAVSNILNLIGRIEIKNYDSFDFITEDNVIEFSNYMGVIELHGREGFEALQNALNSDDKEKLNNNLKFRDLYGKYIWKCNFNVNFFTTVCFDEGKDNKVTFLQNIFRGAGGDLAKAGKRPEDKKDDGYVYTDELNSSKAYLIMHNFRLLNDILCIFKKWQNNDWTYFFDVERYEVIDIFNEDANNVDEFKVISLLLNKIVFLKNDYNEFFDNVLKNINLDFSNLIQIFDTIDLVLTSEEKFSLSEDGEVFDYKNSNDNLSIPRKDLYEPFENLRKNWKRLYNIKIVINKILKLRKEENFNPENYWTAVRDLINSINFDERTARFLKILAKRIITDESLLNYLSNNSENIVNVVDALQNMYYIYPRLFNNRYITWETKAKVTLIKEGDFFKDDTALNIPLKEDEVNRSSVMVRMDKRPELEGDEIVILFELSSRSWWWNRSSFLNLNKGSFTKLAKITEKVPHQKEFLDWIYLNRKKLIVKNTGENSNTLVKDFEELVRDAGFFVLSDNQQKVFDLVHESNKEEFKDNFTQHPEFRATVELLGKTITDTKSFIELYSGFIWAYNLVNSSIQLGLAMQFVMGNVMANFLSMQKTEDVEFINKTLDSFKPKLEHDEVPQIESQPEAIKS